MIEQARIISSCHFLTYVCKSHLKNVISYIALFNKTRDSVDLHEQRSSHSLICRALTRLSSFDEASSAFLARLAQMWTRRRRRSRDDDERVRRVYFHGSRALPLLALATIKLRRRRGTILTTSARSRRARPLLITIIAPRTYRFFLPKVQSASARRTLTTDEESMKPAS